MKTKVAGSASLAALFLLLFIPASLQALETDVLVVRDLMGTLSVDRHAALTKDAREKLDRVLRFYDVGPKVDNLGKIRLEFNPLTFPMCGFRSDEKKVEALLHLLNCNPKDACSEAQRLAGK
jgi:hypothetical protein